MSVRTFSSRAFTRDVSAAKRAAADGPVFITDRGRQAYVLLKIEDYHQLSGAKEMSFLDLMESIPRGEGFRDRTLIASRAHAVLRIRA